MAVERGDAAFVAFEHVQKSYDGETLVVKDLNLGIGKGEFLTMLGPSGSGKTTCLMMLAGFETATHGEITLAGRPINNIPPHKRGIGMVFQNYALFPHMTVGENLAFPLQVRKMDKPTIDAKVARALDMVQMGRFAGRRPAQLSGGQQQRIALARALVFEPELVLMDEPLGALDKQLREHMQFEIKHLHEQLGVTVVYVTHDQSEALTMSDRVAVFNDGRIQQLAPPEDLYERPDERFVAQFIGENNTLFGTVETIDGDVAAPSGSRTAPADRRARRSTCGEPGDAHPALDPARAGRGSAPTVCRREPTARGARCSSSSTMATTSAAGWRSPATTTSSSRCRNAVDQRRADGRRSHDGRLDVRGLPGARRRLTTTAPPAGGRARPSDEPT